MLLKIGCNFDLELIDQLAALNTKYPNSRAKVGELYGSLPSVNPIGSARPNFRLKDGDQTFLADYVKKANANGIVINYTLNTSAVDPRQLIKTEKEIASFLQWLQDIGVRRVTVAHPLVAQLVSTHSSLPMELSTILQIRHPRQLETFKKRYPQIDKICIDVFANRDKEKLHILEDIGRKLKIRLEVIANEFCIFECIDRNQCYDFHALNLTLDETKLFGRYPMGRCISNRIIDPIEWLYARFILPQWMDTYYHKFGIESFKITGRTHPTAFVVKVSEAYMQESYTGNLLELWADVENIGRIESEYRSPRVHIDCGKLPNFMDFYFNSAFPVTQEREKGFINESFRVSYSEQPN